MRAVVVAFLSALTFLGSGVADPSAVALAASGELDPSFGGDGKVTTGFAAGPSFASAAAIQPDGRIVAVGSAGGFASPRNPQFGLVRYTRRGNLDPSFGGDGRVRVRFRDWSYALAVAIQANRKVVAVGRDQDKFGIVRLKPDGTLDRTFGGDGKVRTGFDSRGAEPTAVAIQANGRIVAAGRSFTCGGDDSDFALARYRRDGSLDPTFGGDGKVTTELEPGGCNENSISALAIQDDGKIVAVGTGFPPGVDAESAVVARYDSEGALDATFGGDGLVATDFSPHGSSGTGVALGSDGTIVAAGWAWYQTAAGFRERFALARYLTDGTPDATFSGDGMVSTGFLTRGARASGIAIQADGRIVALGTTRSRHSWFALARYDEEGMLDPTFGGDGKVTTRFGSGSSYASGLVIQENQRIVAAGGTRKKFALARYQP